MAKLEAITNQAKPSINGSTERYVKAGDEFECSEAEAKELVAAGAARRLDKPKPKAKAKIRPENAGKVDDA